jgi:hypothetical protein
MCTTDGRKGRALGALKHGDDPRLLGASAGAGSRTAGGCLHAGPPVPANPAAVREEGFLFRLRTNRLLQNAVLLVRPQLAALGLNSFQAAACEAQRHRATFILTSPDRQIAAGAHRFNEAEINQFLDDFLRRPASQATRRRPGGLSY